MASRAIVVDYNNPLISFQGPWALFNDSLYALSGPGSFTFLSHTPLFLFGVMGSFQNSAPPSYTCYIDGNAIYSPGFIQGSKLFTDALLCLYFYTKSINSINLTVTASGTTDNPFLFSRIDILPDASATLDNATVMVDTLDPQIHYSTGWNHTPAGFATTSERGASLTFDFIGSQISWLASSESMNTVTPQASYSIDNETISPFPGTLPSLYRNPVYFNSPVLPLGTHNLFVQYAGVDSSNPLTLRGLLVQNGSLAHASFTPPASPTTASTPSTTNSGSPSTTILRMSPSVITTEVAGGKLSPGALSGIVIGSLVAGALIMLGLVSVLRFIKRNSAAMRQRPAWYNYGDGLDE
ncbi:hypothetical protein M413DRAFT_29182 [Hebeloma cylindrosporum]|uniref:Uncharacterized protein n=1 Tax=Hebeloma cylindrosporum TaxID=76867 RepID=A0A0C2XP51_HEBCY|nr:hypothetical protein M413DRAFT_29182 [Hebeloma cylindrosporum h7]